MPKSKRESEKLKNGESAGLEAKLWAAADALRNNMDAAEYKHVVLRLIFIKYISDAFESKHAELEAQRKDGADPEDPDEYKAAGIFWVPKEGRWSHLKANAPQPTIGTIVDDAMSAIERDNPSLKGVLVMACRWLATPIMHGATLHPPPGTDGCCGFVLANGSCHPASLMRVRVARHSITTCELNHGESSCSS